MPTVTDVSHSLAVERIARVLAAWPISDNAAGDETHAAAMVDAEWPDRVDQAVAVLRALREPDMAIAAAGDGELWTRMVEAAIAARVRIDLPGADFPPLPDVRDAKVPDDLRSGAGRDPAWNPADQRMDESFPASDPAPLNPGVD